MSKKTNEKSSCQTDCSMKGYKVGLFLFQVLVTTIYAINLHFVYFSIQMPVHKPQGEILGPLKYLTIWNLHFQFLIGLLNILVILTNCSKLTALRNAVHHGLSVPFGINVAGLFWAIYAVDRKLIFPKELDALIPPIMNHIMHTLVGISPMINEFSIFNKRKPTHVYTYFAVFILYMFQLLFIGYYMDFWIYPIFDYLSNTGRFVFLSLCIGLGSLIYLTHGALHNYLWSERIKDEKKKKN